VLVRADSATSFAAPEPRLNNKSKTDPAQKNNYTHSIMSIIMLRIVSGARITDHPETVQPNALTLVKHARSFFDHAARRD
jgi:hypothetical protein